MGEEEACLNKKQKKRIQVMRCDKSQGQAKKLRTGKKVEDRLESREQARKSKTGDKAKNRQ